MNFVKGPHCTIVDPRNDGDPDAIRTKARSLVARFEKLGRSKDMLMVAVSHHRMTRSQGVSLTFRPKPCMEKYRFRRPSLALKLRPDCSAKTESMSISHLCLA